MDVKPEETLRPFVEESRHLLSSLNMMASDMIRNRDLVAKLRDDPSFIKRTYNLSDEEVTAAHDKDLLKLFNLGLHPFLLVRFAGMVGILEYWQALGAPGRGEDARQA
jgi:hypothetical protein